MLHRRRCTWCRSDGWTASPDTVTIVVKSDLGRAEIAKFFDFIRARGAPYTVRRRPMCDANLTRQPFSTVRTGRQNSVGTGDTKHCTRVSQCGCVKTIKRLTRIEVRVTFYPSAKPLFCLTFRPPIAIRPAQALPGLGGVFLFEKGFSAMKALMKTTKSVKPAEVEKKWHLIDAEGLVVGRLADDHRQHPARQAQAELHPARRLRRPCRRDQRRQGPLHRPQAEAEDLLQAHRLCRRPEGSHRRQGARGPLPRARAGKGRRAHDPARAAGPRSDARPAPLQRDRASRMPARTRRRSTSRR